MSAATLLSRLDKVRQTGQGRYLACCPAHEDKNPSLSVRELDDGRLLLHCFTGCDVHSVLSALNLSMADLFPDSGRMPQARPERHPFPAADVLRAVAFEALVVMMAASSLLAGEPFTAMDLERLTLAYTRLQSALQAAGVSHA